MSNPQLNLRLSHEVSALLDTVAAHVGPVCTRPRLAVLALGRGLLEIRQNPGLIFESLAPPFSLPARTSPTAPSAAPAAPAVDAPPPAVRVRTTAVQTPSADAAPAVEAPPVESRSVETSTPPPPPAPSKPRRSKSSKPPAVDAPQRAVARPVEPSEPSEPPRSLLDYATLPRATLEPLVYEAFERVIKGGVALKTLYTTVGIVPSAFYYWRKAAAQGEWNAGYLGDGKLRELARVVGSIPPSVPRATLEPLVYEAVEAALARGMKVKSLCAEVGLSTSAMHRWRKAAARGAWNAGIFGEVKLRTIARFLRVTSPQG